MFRALMTTDSSPETQSPRRPAPLVWGVAAALLLLGGGVIFYLLHHQRSDLKEITLRQPGMDKTAKAGGAAVESPLKRGQLIPGTGQPADIAGEWPRWRGPNGDNISDARIRLANAWEASGPAKLWEIELGEGFAGAAVRHGCVYVMDYDMAKQADALRCLSLADGQEIWRYTYPVKIKRYHGISRTIPTIAGKYIVALGPKCHVICCEAETGKFVWGLDLVQEFGAEVPQWYAGQCPLVDGDRVILAVGAEALLIAVDLATGKVVWKSPNPREWKMTHASVVPVEFGGKKMCVYCGSGGVAGIAADDGKLLWDTTEWIISMATVPSPLPVGDGKIFLSGGYNAGSLMLQLAQVENKISVATLFRLKPGDFGATQQTPILYQGKIFGVRPDGQMTCLDLDGKVRWASGPAAKFGLGPFMIADGKLIVMNDDGRLTLAAASVDGWQQLAQAKVLSGPDSRIRGARSRSSPAACSRAT
ncbi:MAG: PQQ-like beta-propeller repeat protein [Kiritimatiellaeota bacterium]|nr:PQQ-like beta-propeller repeat protein [Kiritimatiellota bacterium]